MVLTWVDYVVIGGYLLAITAFGSYFARFQKTTRDYFLTGQSVPWWAICFTIVATETSTLTFISVPATAYTGDMTFLQLVFGYVIGRLVVSVLFIPAYFRGELFTSYELLQRRLGPRVKNLAAIIFLLTRSLADGVRLFATALVISVVTNVPVTWAVVILGIAMIVYTVRGGASAVIWTDVVQLFVYIAGASVVFASLLALIPGGWGEVVRVGSAAGKFQIFDFSLTLARPYTFWAGVIGGVALTLSTHGTDQFLVQRLLAARSAAEASRGLVLSGILVFAQFVLFLLIGVMLFTYYQHVPMPRTLGRSDELLPTFIVTALTHGAAGFIVAAIVAAALSPSINAMAATTVNDFYAKYYRPGADEQTLMRVSQAVDGDLGRGADRRRDCGAVDAALGAGCRARRPVVCLRTGARRVSDRHARPGDHRAAGICRDACRPRGDDVRLGMDRRRLHLVRLHRRDDHRGGRRAGARDHACAVGGAMSLPAPARAVIAGAMAAGVFPAATADVGSSAGSMFSEAFDTDLATPFDLASLTKAIATTTVVMDLVAQGVLRLEDAVSAFFEEWRSVDRDTVTVRDLLEHASGLPARLLDPPPQGRREFEHDICATPLEYPPRTRSVYSDLGIHPPRVHRRGSRGRLAAGIVRGIMVRLKADPT